MVAASGAAGETAAATAGEEYNPTFECCYSAVIPLLHPSIQYIIRLSSIIVIGCSF